MPLPLVLMVQSLPPSLTQILLLLHPQQEEIVFVLTLQIVLIWGMILALTIMISHLLVWQRLIKLHIHLVYNSQS